MKIFAVSFVLTVLTIASSSAAPSALGVEGKCPVVPFVENFDGDKFTGKWFAIKQNMPKGVPCIVYDISRPSPNHFDSFLTPLNFTLGLEKTNAEDFSEGFTVSFPANPLVDGGNLRLFATDYENYAATMICKQGEKNYYPSFFFWSRSKTMSEEAVAILKETVTKYSLDVLDLEDVKQEGCEAAVAV